MQQHQEQPDEEEVANVYVVHKDAGNSMQTEDSNVVFK